MYQLDIEFPLESFFNTLSLLTSHTRKARPRTATGKWLDGAGQRFVTVPCTVCPHVNLATNPGDTSEVFG